MKSFTLAALTAGLAGVTNAITYNVTLTDKDGSSLPYTLHPSDDSGHQVRRSSPAVASNRRRQDSSANWCGAIWDTNGPWESVTGTWTVPSVSDGSNPSSTEQYLYQWVGIGGWNGCNVILQAGTAIFFQNEQVSIVPWWEIYPDPFTSISGLTVNTGDSVTTTVTTTGAESGTVVIENNSSGQSLTLNVDSSDVGSICTTDAEWIVEDPEELPFPDFSNFDFSGCSATNTGGSTADLSGATTVVIDGKCNVGVNSNSDMTFSP